jgi:2-oxoisovalerate dehydrogenase E1 component beta subunit
MGELTLVEAINLALRSEMQRDKDVVLLGQDVGRDGGVFRATLGLVDAFGPERVIDTPLAEGMIAGMAIGMAVEGLKPVAEIQFSGFAYTCIDQILNHAGRMRYRTRGRMSCPMVLRTPCGGGIHAPEHHSESPEAMFAHMPGIRVVYPSSPRTAYGLLLAAIRDPDPVIYLEPTRLYRLFKEDVEDDGNALPLDTCFTLREGTDVTLVTWGGMVHETLQAADVLAEEGYAAEVLDVATLKPYDLDSILASVSRTGRCVVVSEAPRTAGFASEIAAAVGEHGLLHLMAPVQRVTGFDSVMPLARLEKQYMPSAARIADAARQAIGWSG